MRVVFFIGIVFIVIIFISNGELFFDFGRSVNLNLLTIETDGVNDEDGEIECPTTSGVVTGLFGFVLLVLYNL